MKETQYLKKKNRIKIKFKLVHVTKQDLLFEYPILSDSWRDKARCSTFRRCCLSCQSWPLVQMKKWKCLSPSFCNPRHSVQLYHIWAVGFGGRRRCHHFTLWPNSLVPRLCSRAAAVKTHVSFTSQLTVQWTEEGRGWHGAAKEIYCFMKNVLES